ncbi:kelch domain-containing protein 3 isoform X2, partial [Fagus crenata]
MSMNCVSKFFSIDETWSQPIIKGTPPTSRACHTCTTVGDDLFVFGGTGGKNPLKDLHVLNTSSHAWTSPTIEGDGPEPRKCHSAAFHGARICIFGGSGKSAGKSADDEIFYNDLYWLYTTMDSRFWNKLIVKPLGPARAGHTDMSHLFPTGEFFTKEKLYVFGGYSNSQHLCNDLHALDV